MENTSLKDLLREHIELKGFTPKKISETTGIPERYVEALLTGNDKVLPPAAYVHGYLAKLAEVLNFDKETMWRLYQKEAALYSSGPLDRLPSNRFAVRTFGKKWLIAGLVLVFLLAYLLTNVYQMLSVPELEIINPAMESIITPSGSITLEGKTDPSYTLTVNGAEVYVNKDGQFEKKFQLQPGLNTVEFRVKRFLGKENLAVRQIIYQSPMVVTQPVEPAKTDDKR